MQKNRKHHFDLTYLKMADIWSQSSYAEKLKVGCLIVKDRTIISDGFNGTPKGFDNFCEDMFKHTKPEVLHAEANAITKLCQSSSNSRDATIYITAAPCLSCAKLIIQAGIKRVVYTNPWKHKDGLALLEQAGLEVLFIEEIY